MAFVAGGTLLGTLLENAKMLIARRLGFILSGRPVVAFQDREVVPRGNVHAKNLSSKEVVEYLTEVVRASGNKGGNALLNATIARSLIWTAEQHRRELLSFTLMPRASFRSSFDVLGWLIHCSKNCGYMLLLYDQPTNAAVATQRSRLSPLCLVVGLLCIDIGCGSGEFPDMYASSVLNAPSKVPLYIVDDLVSEQIHSCSGVLNNEGTVPTVYIFEGVTCGCLAGEHDGKELLKGDRIRVAAGDAEEVVLRTRLAYMEGFYSDSAFFQNADDPLRRVVVESRYGVVRRLRLSPGALVFEREEASGPFTADATVRFRRSSNDGRDHTLSVGNLPNPIHWSAKQESQGVKERLSPASEWFYEDEWTVHFRIDSDAHLGLSLPPHGEIDFVVFDGQGEQAARRSLPYNAERVDR